MKSFSQLKESAQSVRPGVMALGVFGLVLAWLGNASVAAWNKFQYPFNELVDIGAVLGDMFSMPLSSVLGVAVGELMLFNLLLLVSFVLLVAAGGAGSINRNRLLLSVAVTLPLGLLGLITFGLPLDGEWLGEGWAMWQAFSIWSVSHWIYSASMLVRNSRSAEPLEVAPAIS